MLERTCLFWDAFVANVVRLNWGVDCHMELIRESQYSEPKG